MHPIAERILRGEDVCPGEIWQSNARTIIAIEQAWAKRGAHEAKGCKDKNCTHGQGSDLWYAAELTERAARDCTCGGHK